MGGGPGGTGTGSLFLYSFAEFTVVGFAFVKHALDFEILLRLRFLAPARAGRASARTRGDVAMEGSHMLLDEWFSVSSCRARAPSVPRGVLFSRHDRSRWQGATWRAASPFHR